MSKVITIAPYLKQFIEESAWDNSVQEAFQTYLSNNEDVLNKLNMLFTDTEMFDTCVPILTYLENHDDFVVLFTNKEFMPPEPGECGSILSYFRAYGYDDDTLHSDCYGQLSCSSCAVELLNGSPENTTPRDEEYDMLSIDDQRKPTQYTRLSCQTVIGSTPIILTIRK